VLIFGVAATCNLCEALGLESSGEKVTTNSQVTTDSVVTTDTTKPDANLLNGVVPTKVTGHVSDMTK
jgi:hypothetical protein